MEVPHSGGGARDVLPFADRVAKQKGQAATLQRRPRPGENIIFALLFLSGALSILTTVGFTLVLGREALRFFSTTEWLNTNRLTVTALDADDTRVLVNLRGSAIREGQTIRLGALDGSENALILAANTSEMGVELELERGTRGTTPAPHGPNTTLYRAEEVTLGAFFTQTAWAPQIGRFGILPLLSATLQATAIGLLVAIPLGLGSAIYLSEYASARARGILKPIVEILAGVPTVVFGYYALTYITPGLRNIFGASTVSIYNIAAAGIAIGLLITPTISSISEDALSAVPNNLREAAYGLGSTRFETTVRVLLPAALSGISAAIILAISRAVGETMIVLVAGGAGPRLTANPFESAETMAAHIARISTGDISFASIDYNSVFAVGFTLFIMTLLLNLVSALVTRRFREIYA